MWNVRCMKYKSQKPCGQILYTNIDFQSVGTRRDERRSHCFPPKRTKYTPHRGRELSMKAVQMKTYTHTKAHTFTNGAHFNGLNVCFFAVLHCVYGVHSSYTHRHIYMHWYVFLGLPRTKLANQLAESCTFCWETTVYPSH